MADREKPEVHLQITSGVLRLSTDDAVYYISAPPASEIDYPHPGVEHRLLNQDQTASPSPVVTIDPVPAEAPPAGGGGADEAALEELRKAAQEAAQALRETEQEKDYFLGLAQKYHHRVGALTRRISLEPGRDHGDGPQVEGFPEEVGAASERLGLALDKGGKIRDLLAPLAALEILGPEEKAALAEKISPGLPAAVGQSPLLDKCRQINDSSLSLLELISKTLAEPAPVPEAPPQPPPPKKEIKTVKRLFFPLNDLFQIVYELAIGEEVKKAIKAVWDKIGDFDEAQINSSLLPQAESFEIDDGFVMVPLEPLFKSLFVAASDDAHKSTIKKLNANRQKLFLDQTLPVEERYQEVQEEVEVPGDPVPPPQPAAAPAPDHSDLLAKIGKLSTALKSLRPDLESPPAPPAQEEAAAGGPDDLSPLTLVRGAESLNLVGDLTSAQELLAEHLSLLQEIRESLAGLNLEPPVREERPAPGTGPMIDLLDLLVEFHTRLDRAAEFAESGEEAAQTGVESKLQEMRKKLGIGPDGQGGPESGEPDPAILNYLLADMGF